MTCAFDARMAVGRARFPAGMNPDVEPFGWAGGREAFLAGPKRRKLPTTKRKLAQALDSGASQIGEE